MKTRLRPIVLMIGSVVAAWSMGGCTSASPEAMPHRTARVELIEDGRLFTSGTDEYRTLRPELARLLAEHGFSLTDAPTRLHYVVRVDAENRADGGKHLTLRHVRLESASQPHPTYVAREDAPLPDRSGASLDLVEANRRLGETYGP